MREGEIQGNEEHGLISEPRFGAKTSLKEFLDKIPKEPDPCWESESSLGPAE